MKPSKFYINLIVGIVFSLQFAIAANVYGEGVYGEGAYGGKDPMPDNQTVSQNDLSKNIDQKNDYIYNYYNTSIANNTFNYITEYSFPITIAISIFGGLEILSLILLKSELVWYVLKKFRKSKL